MYYDILAYCDTVTY